ncbi:ADP-ribose pyrophosphatase YjhB (NUDIX family) [Scopulibacillus darangshiensis]|uniref:ADP-ribose pyrophosphatase YjhB (NUDIX family) n=1 Tax=Scopulibacillus darangshiensis TaxID=442528 RepID=A0A4R2P8N7_9BACL|nr:NUDIX domain-containing protein [Scopulibacillus darangshiensis]TCP31217.1 ADP-ribose pyrophosphatase YjhB (NUDIX family) [Scopulibacillus darangshiensis]
MTNKDALKHYDVNQYRTPDGYTSDIAVFTITSEKTGVYKPPEMTLKLMLIKRSVKDAEDNPNIEAEKWALPGGFVETSETAFEAARRELEEETSVKDVHLKHFGVYDRPGRDPRGWIISNAHYAIVPEHDLTARKANDDAAEVKLFSLDELKTIALAFDHDTIIIDAIKMITSDLLQTTVAKAFLPKAFTYSELQAVLLTVTNDPAIASHQSFARKIKTLPFIQEVKGQTTSRTSKKPTQLYQFNDMEVVKPIYTARY